MQKNKYFTHYASDGRQACKSSCKTSSHCSSLLIKQERVMTNFSWTT